MASNLIVNNVKVDKVIYNGTDLDTLKIGNTTVFQKDFIFKDGVTNTEYGGIYWRDSGYNTSYSVSDNKMVFYVPPAPGGWQFDVRSVDKIDLIPYTKMKVLIDSCVKPADPDIIASGEPGGSLHFRVCETTEVTASGIIPIRNVFYTGKNDTPIEIEMDISDLTSSYWVAINIQNTNGDGDITAKISRWWLV